MKLDDGNGNDNDEADGGDCFFVLFFWLSKNVRILKEEKNFFFVLFFSVKM